MAAAGLEVRLEPLQGALPAIRWRRDEETEILSGGFKSAAKGRGGASITVELADAEGAIVVLDVVAGRLTGLDVVIWPALDPVPGLKPPATSRDAEVLWPAKPAAISAAAVELETPLLASTNDAGTLLHLELGRSRLAETVRLADHLLADIDDRQRLAGLWLLDLPQLDPALDDDEAYL